MKTLKNAITLVALFAFLFTNKSFAQSISPKEIANLHNKILENVVKNKRSIKNVNDLENFILNSNVKKIKQSEKQKIKLQVIDKYLIEFKKTKSIDDLLISLGKIPNFPSKLNNLILSLNEAIKKKDKSLFNKALYNIRTYKPSSTNEKFIKDVFVSIWDASDNFWHNNKGGKWKWSWQDSVVVLTDAVSGAAGAAVSGGVAGYFTAAFGSALVGSLISD